MAFKRSGVQIPYPPLDLRRPLPSQGREQGRDKPPGQRKLTRGYRSEPFGPPLLLEGSLMRQPKPWFRASKNAWYVQIGKRQVCLRQDEAAAYQKYYRLMAQDLVMASGPRPEMQVAVLFDCFLDHSRKQNSKLTYEWYQRFLQSF